MATEAAADTATNDASASPDSPEGWRVKLYQLNDDGQWDDRGTGKIRVDHAEALGTPCVHVVSEESSRDLVTSRITEDRDAYSLQGESIITWEERRGAQGSLDLALSFQENEGCMQIWHQIQEIQGRLTTGFGNTNIEADGPMPEEWPVGPPPSLPECRLANLDEIHRHLSSATNNREQYAAALLSEDGVYVKTLLDVFSDCEDLEDTANLAIIANIAKSLVLLNDMSLMEYLLTTELYAKVVGCLEYSTDLKHKADHRKSLETAAKFQEVVPMNEIIREKILLNFRATFLKDIVTRPGMDEASTSTLSSFVFFNNSEILSSLHTNCDLLKRVVEELKSQALTNASDSKERNFQSRSGALCFLKEMCNTAKNVQITCRDALFHHLVEETDFFQAITLVLEDTDNMPLSERLMSAELLSNAVCWDGAASFRKHVLNSGGHPPIPPSDSKNQGEAGGTDKASSLLWHVVRLITSESDTGVLLHLLDVVKTCLDTEPMEPSERDKFLALFYDHYIKWLVDPVLPNEKDDSDRPVTDTVSVPTSPERMTMQGYVCDLLSSCVRTHTYRMKYFVLGNRIVGRILSLADTDDKFLKLAAIRFVRSIIGVKDDFYNRYLVKNGLLAPLFVLLKTVAHKDCLLTSAIVDMADHIRTENIKALVEHVVEKYSDSFDQVEHVDTFKNLVLKHEQNTESGASLQVSDTNGPPTKEEHRMKVAQEDDDEAYFDTADETVDEAAETAAQAEEGSTEVDMAEFKPRPTSPPADTSATANTSLGRMFDIESRQSGKDQKQMLGVRKIECLSDWEPGQNSDLNSESNGDSMEAGKRQKLCPND